MIVIVQTIMLVVVIYAAIGIQGGVEWITDLL
jgi:hypothetical protein